MNASPSLTASSKEDYELKFGLLEDMLCIVDLENWYRTLIQSYNMQIAILICLI